MFNPNEHTMQFTSRAKQKDGTWTTLTTEYLPVQWRLVWFREQCPEGTIDIEEIAVDLDREITKEVSIYNKAKQCSELVQKTARGYARYKAIVTDGKGGRASGTKSECAVDFPDFCEKAETGAIGRALAGLGYGTQFAPELNEEERLTDGPSQAAQRQQPGRITKSQLESIRNLCRLLGRDVAEGTEVLGEQNARELLATLSQQWKDKQFKDSHAAKAQPTEEAAIPSGADLQAEVASRRLIWKDILAKAFAKQIKGGRLNIADLVAAGPNLSPGQRQQLAAYLVFIKDESAQQAS